MLMRVTPKPKKCKECGNKFQPRGSFDKVCESMDCKLSFALKAATKSKAKREADAKRKATAERKSDREKLQSLKKRNEWMADAQRVFNQFIRLRDMLAGHVCISSGRTLDWASRNKVDAGHYRSVGSAPHLRFCEDNVHAQSKHDNRFLGGCAVDYRIRLIDRIGLKRVEEIEADQVPRHYSIDDLKALIATYKQKIKEMECAAK